MTPIQLSNQILVEHDNTKVWPRTWEVDHETYANVCQHFFDTFHMREQPGFISIALGPNGGILYHSVELILKVNRTCLLK
jgi:hypothetical protein